MATTDLESPHSSSIELVRRNRGLWLLLLLLPVIAFIAYALPPYLTFDPSRSRIPPPADNPAYYPLLLMHVGFGAIAMLAGWMQLWTGSQRRHLTLHRLTGRIYVFGGVLPASALGMAIGLMGQFGPVLVASNVVLAVLWFTCTVIGFRFGQQRRFDNHRRWMIRSYVLTFSIITNRIWAPIAALVLVPQLPTAFGGNPTFMVHAIAGLSGWLGWVLPLVAAEWWIIERFAKTSARG